MQVVRPYLRGIEGAILVYSINDRGSFDRILVWAERVREIATQPVLVLVGAKTDMKEREVSYCEGAILAEQLQAVFLETSAKENRNVTQVFYALLTLIGQRMGFNTRLGFHR